MVRFGILLVFCASSYVQAEDVRPRLPHDAQAAIEASALTQNKIEDDAKHKIAIEQKKLCDLLDKASKDAGKKGDLDGAFAIRDVLKKINAAANIEDQLSLLGEKVDPSKAIIGQWKISKPGWSGILTVKENGILFSDRGIENGKWTIKGDVIMFAYNNSKYWDSATLPVSDNMSGNSWDNDKGTTTFIRVINEIKK